MAKLKSPLLSFSAHGTLGDVLVFFDRHGKSYARSKPKDPISLSIGQGLLRDCFVSAALSAHSLTQGQKDFYADLAPDSSFCPWWNNFIGQYIKDNYEVPGVATTFIKSLQIVTCTIDDGIQTQDTLITSVDKNYSVPISLGFGASNDDSRNSFAMCLLSDNTHIRLSRSPEPKVGELLASVLVVEFEPDFIVYKVDKVLAFADPDTVATETIDEVDLNKTLIFPLGRRSFDDVGYSELYSYVDLQDSTTLRARRVVSGSNCDSRWCVVQFI